MASEVIQEKTIYQGNAEAEEFAFPFFCPNLFCIFFRTKKEDDINDEIIYKIKKSDKNKDKRKKKKDLRTERKTSPRSYGELSRSKMRFRSAVSSTCSKSLLL